MSETPVRRLPAVYRTATWRNVTPVDEPFDEIGIGFDVGSDVVRLRLSVVDARHLIESIGDYLGRSQSPTSSGAPSEDVSTPEEGVCVCPPQKSSTACWGDG